MSTQRTSAAIAQDSSSVTSRDTTTAEAKVSVQWVFILISMFSIMM